MKYLFFSIAFLIVSNIYCQTCNDGYYPFKSGTSWELTSYNANNKLTDKSAQIINSVLKSTNGFKANISATGTDAKGKETFNTNYDIECINNLFRVDMKNMFRPEQLNAYKDNKDMTIEFGGDNLETPKNLRVGDSLKTSSVTMTVKNKGDVMVTMIMEVYDRYVQAKEELTVPAGTYSCYKISYKTRVTSSYAGIPMKSSFETTQWLSKGVGMVKMENYNKGKVSSYTLLSKFSN